MKKISLIIVLLVVMVFLLIPCSVVKAENLDDSTIIKYNYYPTFSVDKELIFQWTSSEKIEDLSIKVYLPTEDKYVEIFNMNWDLDKKDENEDNNLDPDNKTPSVDEDEKTNGDKTQDELDEELTYFDIIELYHVKFTVLTQKLDDENTPNVDESTIGNWEYRIKFSYNDSTLSVLKLVLDYKANEKEYSNYFILQNITTPQIIPPVETEQEVEDFTSRNALFAACFAAVCSVIGTVLIISSTSNKFLEDEENAE